MPNLSVEKESDDSLVNLLAQLKSDIESRLNMKFTLFKPIRYRTQTVRGTNFYVKIKIAGQQQHQLEQNENDHHQDVLANNNQPIKFIHVRFWRDLPVNNFKLTLYDQILVDKLESDPIDYFE